MTRRRPGPSLRSLVASSALCVLAAAWASPRAARAQAPQTRGALSQVAYAAVAGGDSVALGQGVSAVRQRVLCTYRPCTQLWDPRGFSFGDQHAFLVRANTFAPGPGGRIFGAVDAQLLYTQDLGVSWRRARWEGGPAPLAIAFDGSFGAAVGDNGTVFTTEDGGLTWRNRRDSSGVRNIAVAVLAPRTVVWSDMNGGVFASLDGGFTPRTLVEPNRAALVGAVPHGMNVGPVDATVAAPAFRVERGAIWVPARAGWFRVDPNEGVLTVRPEGP